MEQNSWVLLYWKYHILHHFVGESERLSFCVPMMGSTGKNINWRQQRMPFRRFVQPVFLSNSIKSNHICSEYEKVDPVLGTE